MENIFYTENTVIAVHFAGDNLFFLLKENTTTDIFYDRLTVMETARHKLNTPEQGS